MSKEAATPIDRKIDSQRFDDVAAGYDAHRPSYPAELIDDIVLYAGIQQDERILEIGCGTGIATLLFAQRGCTMLCLEPGQNLIAIASEKLKSYPQVRFVMARFEEWDAGQEKFDLVISAQAYHWVPAAVRYEKTASVLKQSGHLAVFWNMYPGKAYLGLLNTYSDHLRLPQQRRSELFEAVAEVVERNGGYIEKPYLAVVYLAQRTSAGA